MGYGIAINSTGSAYVTGVTYSTDFPTKNAFQNTYKSVNLGGGDAFVAKLAANGSDLIYSTYLGGFNMDWGRDSRQTHSGMHTLLALLNPTISLQRMRSSKVYKATGTYSLSNLRFRSYLFHLPWQRRFRRTSYCRRRARCCIRHRFHEIQRSPPKTLCRATAAWPPRRLYN